LLLNNSESIETAYMNFHNFIKMFIGHFYDPNERLILKVEEIGNIIKKLRVENKLDLKDYDPNFENLVTHIHKIYKSQ
jgi:hypothetical protein